MAKKLADVIAFKPRTSQIIPFPTTQLCGCGCGTLLNKQEDAFIICEEYGQWYASEYDFLKAMDVVEYNGYYRFITTDYWYTKTDFYEELGAYWINEFVPIA